MIAPGGQQRYSFTPRTCGLALVSHAHLRRRMTSSEALYTGQFGCFYIEPKEEPGAYDQEIFLTLHDWNAYMGGRRRRLDGCVLRIRDHQWHRMLGHGTRSGEAEGQRVMLRIAQRQRYVTHWLALAGP